MSAPVKMGRYDIVSSVTTAKYKRHSNFQDPALKQEKKHNYVQDQDA